MLKWLKKLEQWLGKGTEGKKKMQTYRLLLIIGLLGLALMLINSFINVKHVEPDGAGREPPVMQELTSGNLLQEDGEGGGPFAKIEASLESKAKEILEKIVGVGDVDVLVTVESTEEVIVQRNMRDTQEMTEEVDADGGTRNITQYSRDGEIVTYDASGNEQPIVTKKIKPKVRGVLIVARGAENNVVKGLIVDAVEKGLNVPAYRISVVPRKQSQ
ncbi:stage III sporulation protein AG [Paenibacillus brevis]|uniref:Stage III sporulation protein AG n=1 Tax=Paenibacillus brevis TaxID=2841508 RepID=A0ABS6FU06_9BACL|nr:stage III sporulation protein AG [Paenibacillus brevis]MBU5672962.1 stage III sporulation protein AG [Paenibacillus brevis]